ncbi:hypothetical protein CI610_02798 [invertebrate metagenome]|uniref:Uncharacterized protein n=1 Tax=invertebrate metagenome TaxID=1711999 RepID=A0A2H9T4Y1_9ZZZZ
MLLYSMYCNHALKIEVIEYLNSIMLQSCFVDLVNLSYALYHAATMLQ